jgi:uncharacterized membrane protein SpoIIM required for sporulation
MKQDAFARIHGPDWTRFARWLKSRSAPKKSELPIDDPNALADHEFPAAYRRICQQLAIAKRRGYSPALIAELQEFADTGHAVLYRPPVPRLMRVIQFFAHEFPQLIRAHKQFMALSALLFFGPLMTMIVLLHFRPELAHSLFDGQQLAEFESMYNPARQGDRLARGDQTDVMMFGYYIFNNVSIGFRTFASGLLAGLGAVVVLLSNGVIIGGVAGHLTVIGYGGPFWQFVVGHSAPELLGIVISGGAGLQLGWALVAPGRKTRPRALADAAVIGVRLVAGVFAMLVFAAFIEAFWSSIAWIPAAVKFTVGALIWASFLLWFWRGGRGVALSHDVAVAITEPRDAH